MVACTAGPIRRRPKKPWICSDTLKIIDQRRSARLSGNLAEYRRLNRECNAAIRNDRRKFWNDQAECLEKAAQTNNFSWPLTGTLSSRLDGFDSRALRSILGIHWRDLVSNETVRTLAGQPPASSLAARRRVCWYGHVLRLPPHHSSRAILDFDLGSFGWKRPRGAPRTRWLDVVKRDLDQLGLDPAAIEPLAQVRDKWWALVNMVGTTRRRALCTRHDDDDDVASA